MRIHWNRVSYPKKLFLIFIIISSIPVFLLGTVAYQKSAEMLQTQVKQDLGIIAGQLNTSIERQINDFDRFTILPYYMPEAFSFLKEVALPVEEWEYSQLDAQRKLIRLMSAYPSIHASIKGMVMYGVNGEISGYRLNGKSKLNPDYRAEEEPWFQEAIKMKGGFVVSGLYEIRQFEDDPFPAITGARMLMDERLRPLAVFAIHISPDFIDRIVKSSQIQDAYVLVTDAKGKLIYASDQELAAQLPRLLHDAQREVWELNMETDDPESTIRISGVSRHSRYLGWTIYLGMDRDKLLRGSYLIRSYTLALTAGLVVAAAIVSWLLAKGLSNPILRLIRVMREVELGKFVVPDRPRRNDEIGQLYRSFARMVQRLDEMVRSIEEKERQKRHAELHALSARIQPHFLYNTLNSIRMLAILQQATQIARLIQSLNKLLQANIRISDDLVPLREEIALLRDYARLMDLRYTNTFDIWWNIPDDLMDAGVLPLLLQPIVENAIFHASKGLGRILNIEISAKRDGTGRILQIEIRDDGIGMPEEQVAQLMSGRNRNAPHVGVNNVRDRIQLRFGKEFGAFIKSAQGSGTTVLLTMPYQRVSGGVQDVESAGGGG